MHFLDAIGVISSLLSSSKIMVLHSACPAAITPSSLLLSRPGGYHSIFGNAARAVFCTQSLKLISSLYTGFVF